MSKFNWEKTKFTLNKSGVKAYKLSDKEKLVTMVLTTMFGEEKYYGDNTDELMNLAADLIARGEGQFVANLAVFVRNEMGLRSVSHALCALLAGNEKGKEFVKYAVAGVCKRADDILEILSCYIHIFGKPIANSLKKALAKAMNTFDEYSFAKYNGGNKEIKFIDVLRLTHAKAKDEKQNQIFNAIINDTLKTPYTWETQLSERGNTKDVWEELIDSGKLGMMAMVRNLNNILNSKAENLDKVLNAFGNEEAVKKSKILPFRFYSAYINVENNPNSSSKVLDALETGVETSTKNIPMLKGKTCIAIDVSGSMSGTISLNSQVRCVDIAALLGAMASKICEDSIVMTFDTNIKRQSFSSKNGIIANAKSITPTWGGTAIGLPLVELLDNNIYVDRIIILSDNEVNARIDYPFQYYDDERKKIGKPLSCQELFELYKKYVNKNVILHGVDLVGYGTSQFRGKNEFIISGWNEKIFDFIHLAEEGFGNLVKVIELYNEVSGSDVDADAEG